MAEPASRAPATFRLATRGDGPPVARDLNACVAGKTIMSVDMGAMSEEGYSVTRLRLLGGDSVLIFPQPVDPRVTARTGLRLAIRFVYFPNAARLISVPGR